MYPLPSHNTAQFMYTSCCCLIRYPSPPLCPLLYFLINLLTPVVSKSYLVSPKLMGIFMGDLILGVIL